MTILILLIASCVSAILYRMGGDKRYNTLYRDIGCATVACILAGHLIVWSWTLILCFGLMWGALSTYWKFSKKNCKWYHWLATGVGYSVAMLPLVIQVGCWKGFISRTIVLGVATMIWSELQSNDIKEELGRGFLIPLTLPLLLI